MGGIDRRSECIKEYYSNIAAKVSIDPYKENFV